MTAMDGDRPVVDSGRWAADQKDPYWEDLEGRTLPVIGWQPMPAPMKTSEAQL